MASQPSTIRAEFEKFKRAVYQGQEHLMQGHQRAQIAQAFYGGAQVMFALVNQAAEFDEETGAQFAQKFHEELEGFFRMQRQLYEGRTIRVDI